MRVLLTGATGLIGSAVGRALAEYHEVETLGRSSSADIQADLSKPESILRSSFGEVDALVHCAGVVDEDFAEDPARAFRMATAGAEALVQRALEAGASNLVYVSSAHVYGPMEGVKDESSPPDPRTDYAIAHFATEQVFKRHTTGPVAGVALRPCAVFGDLPDPSSFRRWSLIPFAFPRQARMSGEITIRSTGEQRRNFVGTQDIAGTIVKWLDGSSSGWDAINPLGSRSMSVYEFATLCVEVASEFTGQLGKVHRQEPSGPVSGDDFQYGSQYEIATGHQDLRAVVTRLMTASALEV